MIKLINHYLSKILTKYPFVEPGNSSDADETINGSYRVKKTTVPQSITINGEAILEDEVIIQEKIIINGSLMAKNVLFESDLVVNGTISIVDSNIKGQAFLRGVLQSANSKFLNPIQLLGDTSNFEQCQINNILVQQLPYGKIVQKIQLTNRTTVSGDIIFQAGMGKVYIDATSVIQGNIIGGELIPCF